MRVEVLIRAVLDPDEDVPVERDMLTIRREETLLHGPDAEDPRELLGQMASQLEEIVDESVAALRSKLAQIADHLAS